MTLATPSIGRRRRAAGPAQPGGEAGRRDCCSRRPAGRDPRPGHPGGGASPSNSAVLPLFGVRYGTLARRGWPLLLGGVGVVADARPVRRRPRRCRSCSRSARRRHHRRADQRARAGAAAGRAGAARRPGVRHHRPDRPGRRAGAERARRRPGSRSATLAAFRLVPLLGAGVAGADAWPAGPAASTPGGNPVAAAAAVRRRRCSRCWSARSGGAPGWRPRWTPAASTPGTPRTHAREQRFTRADALFVLGAALLAGGDPHGEHRHGYVPARSRLRPRAASDAGPRSAWRRVERRWR